MEQAKPIKSDVVDLRQKAYDWCNELRSAIDNSTEIINFTIVPGDDWMKMATQDIYIPMIFVPSCKDMLPIMVYCYPFGKHSTPKISFYFILNLEELSTEHSEAVAEAKKNAEAFYQFIMHESDGTGKVPNFRRQDFINFKKKA